jgi:hypothetical protein
MMMCSSPSTWTSVPEYFENRIAVALLHVERVHLAVVGHLALADRDHLALRRLLLRRVGDDDPALRLLSSSIRFTRIRSCSGRIFMGYLSLDRRFERRLGGEWRRPMGRRAGTALWQSHLASAKKGRSL